MCECMPCMSRGLRRLEVGTRSSEAGVTGNCEPSCVEEQIEFLKGRAISPDLHKLLIYLFYHELLLPSRTVDLKLDTERFL